MKKIHLLYLLFIVIVSCTSQKEEKKYDLKDSVIKEYIDRYDILPLQDTAEMSYRILKAYKNDDTGFFKQLQLEMSAQNGMYDCWNYFDRYIHLPTLENTGADEAYRFKYSEAFCELAFNATISKTGSNITLHFIYHRLTKDTSVSRIIDEYNKKLTQNDWDDIKAALDSASFWGLKTDDDMHGADGSDLAIEGYIKGDSNFLRPSKATLVYRWLPQRLALFKAYSLIVKLADIKEVPPGAKNSNKKVLLTGPCSWNEEK